MTLAAEFEKVTPKELKLTDQERLMQLLTDFGVGFIDDSDGRITCESGEPKILGFSGFYTVFVFDEQGKFHHMGAWE